MNLPELLWRGYPTDQRGTYFRQFWDVSVAVEGDKLKLLQDKIRQLQELFQQRHITDIDRIQETIGILQQTFQRGHISDEEKIQIMNLLPREDHGPIIDVLQGVSTELEKISERYADIKEIHKWKESSLGQSQNDSSGERTVLIIKGEILRRYPSEI